MVSDDYSLARVSDGVAAAPLSTRPASAGRSGQCHLPHFDYSVSGFEIVVSGHLLFIQYMPESAGIDRYGQVWLGREFDCVTSQVENSWASTKNGRLRIPWSWVRAPPALLKRLVSRSVSPSGLAQHAGYTWVHNPFGVDQ